MNRTQGEKCLWTWIWTSDETVPEEPEEPETEQVERIPVPEPESVEPEPPTQPRRASKSAKLLVQENFAAQDFGRNNLISKRSGNLW